MRGGAWATCRSRPCSWRRAISRSLHLPHSLSLSRVNTARRLSSLVRGTPCAAPAPPRWCRRAQVPRPRLQPCVHPTRRTVASHTVEGVAVFRRDRLEARGQGFNEHAVAPWAATERPRRSARNWGTSKLRSSGRRRSSTQHLPIDLMFLLLDSIELNDFRITGLC
jgi:hypothetical protein